MYTFSFTHTRDSIRALSIMHYKLFETGARIVRDITAATMLVLGVVLIQNWWAFLLIFYGSFLLTGRYNSPRRKADKIIKALKESDRSFPSSKYKFDNFGIHVFETGSEKEEALLAYKNVYEIGEDGEYLFFFRDRYGGYVISKEVIQGKNGDENLDEFRKYVENKTGKKFVKARTPFMMLKDGVSKLRQRFHDSKSRKNRKKL